MHVDLVTHLLLAQDQGLVAFEFIVGSVVGE